MDIICRKRSFSSLLGLVRVKALKMGEILILGQTFSLLTCLNLYTHQIAPEQTVEQRALVAAAPMESMRFLLEMDDLTEEKGGDSDNSVAVGKKVGALFL